MTLNVLVIGGNRFVGYDLVWRLLAGGHDVTLFNRGTLADPFAGRVSYFKVMSGVVKNDATLANFNRGGTEKLAHIASLPQKHTSTR